jgi:hypothetical protein
VRRGATLVEVAIAAGLVLVVMGAGMAMLSGAGRRARRGQASAEGAAAALLVTSALERDLARVLQVPGDPRPPVVVTDDGAAFYVSDPARSGPDQVVGSPVAWGLAPLGPGRFHPTRNGEPLRSVEVADLSFSLAEPDAASERPTWTLVFEVLVHRSDGRPPDKVRRAVPLAQPSTNFLFYPSHGALVDPRWVRMLPWPADLEPRIEPPELGAPSPPPATPEATP